MIYVDEGEVSSAICYSLEWGYIPVTRVTGLMDTALISHDSPAYREQQPDHADY